MGPGGPGAPGGQAMQGGWVISSQILKGIFCISLKLKFNYAGMRP
jgi:hypothetical protein